MAPALEISIPSTSTSSTTKPYTLYNISLRQPLRSWTVSKRYSDFVALNTSLTTQCSNTSPPAPLPAKSWFKSTTSSPTLTEDRRSGLETYLQAINDGKDDRWRKTPAWRSFLNLPNNSGSGKDGPGPGSAVAAAVELATRSADFQAAITDPVVWLDVYREVKTLLRDARLSLTKRDQASTAQLQHESSADAKRALVRSGTIIAALDRGLLHLGGNSSTAGASKRKAGDSNSDAPIIGEGELRRRKDLLGAVKKERDALDSLLNNFSPSQAPNSDTAVASAGQKQELLKGANGFSRTSSSRRVLGAKETDRTRELDNVGVLQLQQQIMQEQDQDVGDLTKVVHRMKEMGVQINEELVLQNEMLGLLDQDVDRVADKIDVAKKCIGKIR